MTVKAIDNPISMQDRLKDMQSLLILKSIRGHHDANPTVLSALDHAIRIIQERHDRKKQESADDFRLSFMRDALAMVERGEGTITNIGVDRDIESINVASLSGSGMRMIPGRADMKYTIEVVGVMKR